MSNTTTKTKPMHTENTLITPAIYSIFIEEEILTHIAQRKHNSQTYSD